MNVLYRQPRTGVKISLNQRDACIYYRQNPIQCIKSSAATDEFGTLRTFSASSLGISVNAIGTMQNIHYLTRNHLPRRVKELIVPVFNFPPSHYRVYMFLFIFVVCMQAGGCFILCASVAAEKKLFCLVLKQTCFDFFYRTIMIYRSINLLNRPKNISF